MTARFIGVAGLPRAGSTLLCQLLAQHPDLHCESNSSPLCHLVTGMRHMVSDDAFFCPSWTRHLRPAMPI
ncbi:sulfotransferase [Janthinobacterium aquaticum]|uniref:sulfotransferase n=1 Tax=Janthinobacterium sp. FT58W TaxID=2654254 RepID=UPI00186B4263|nr:sulfotransferase [Janthinobacterium sp. FT58W]